MVHFGAEIIHLCTLSMTNGSAEVNWKIFLRFFSENFFPQIILTNSSCQGQSSEKKNYDYEKTMTDTALLYLIVNHLGQPSISSYKSAAIGSNFSISQTSENKNLQVVEVETNLSSRIETDKCFL